MTLHDAVGVIVKRAQTTEIVAQVAGIYARSECRMIVCVI